MRPIGPIRLLLAAAAIIAVGPATAGRTAADLPTIPVRFGDHAGFSRAVFDWPARVDYKVETSLGKATLRFSKPAKIPFRRFNYMAPKYIEGVRARLDKTGTVVEFDIPVGADLRHHRIGARIVIDVRAGTLAATAQPAAKERQPSAGEAKRAAAKQPRSEKPAAPQMPETSAQPAPPEPATTSAETAPPKPPSREPIPLIVSKLDSSPARKATEFLPLPPDPTGTKLIVGAHRTAEGVRLSFSWDKSTAAAVFSRAGHLWVVFDRPRVADLASVTGQIEVELSGLVDFAEQVPSRRATILRFRVGDLLRPTVSRMKDAWIVDLTPKAPRPYNPIVVSPEPIAPGGPRVFLSALEAGEVLAFEDPEVGDTLIVVPLARPDQGVVTRRRFVQFAILETVQGIALVPKTRGIQVTPLRAGVAITNTQGLLISHGWSKSDELRLEDDSEKQKPAIFLIEQWRRGEFGARSDGEQELLATLSKAPEAGRNAVRFELAKFYFAHGLGAEALGVMARIVEVDTRAAADRQFRAIRGAAHLLANQLAKAEADLFHRDLDEDAEIALWRGAVAAAKRDWDRAGREFAIGIDALPSIPADLRPKFRLAMAEVGLASDNLTSVKVQASAITRDRPSRNELVRVAYIEARADHISGNHTDALAAYDRLIAGNHRPTQVLAKSERIRLLRERGEITAEEAIDELETLRFAWRGDAVELDFLTRLGRLYIKSGNYRNGLSIMRQAIAYFPEDGGRALAREMNEVFAKLFLDGAADRLQPITALGLFYDFRELTPVGARGDKMIRRLADRLVAVDLLSRAANLLEHQFKFRLKGAKKAEVGSRLAIIHLLNRKPEQALNALRASRWQKLPKPAYLERRRLEARALTDLNRFGEANGLLVGDVSRPADILRADIHWRAKNWGDAAPAFASLLDERWRDEAPLEPLERQQVMQLAIALALSQDGPALAELNRNYEGKLAGLPEGDALAVIAGQDIDRGSTGVRDLAGAIARVSQLEAFMTSYREQLRRDAKHAIN